MNSVIISIKLNLYMICTAFLISSCNILHMHVKVWLSICCTHVNCKFLAQQNLVFQNNMIDINDFFQWNLGIKLEFVHV